MTEGRITFRVERPPSDVFAYIGDLERAPEWVPDLVSMTKVTDGEVGVGTRYTEVVKMGSRMGEAELEVTAYEPDRLFAHKGEGGPSRFTGRFTLEPDGGGTVVTHDYTVQLTGLSRLMGPFVTGWVRRNIEAGTDNLKRLLEPSKA